MSFVFDIPRLVFGEAAEKAGCCGTLMQAFFRRLREKQEKKTAWNDNRIETP